MRSNSGVRYSGASSAPLLKRGIQIGIGHLDQVFQLRQFGVGKIGDRGVGEAAENQIHLAGAAMPAAKQQPLAAVIQAIARSCRSRHLSFHPNAKSPDVPGGVDITTAVMIVSPVIRVFMRSFSGQASSPPANPFA